MVVAAGSVVAVAPGRTVHLFGREYRVVPPSRRDPRLQVAAVLVSVQALGQGPLHFDVSIAQILCSLVTCAVLEVLVVAAKEHLIAWPGSALLTGNGVALLLRVPGTQHGDWFSFRGAHLFAGTAALSLATKYVFRFRAHQLFNPSNLGLVVCFLALGPVHVDPQDLWWGPTGTGLVVTVVLIVAGGLFVTARLGLLPMAAAFWITFASGVALIGASGHCMTARWSIEPVCDARYTRIVALSPEVLIFLFFMITDPRSTPRGRVARVVFGALVGALAAMLVSFQRTEFATKVAVLAALVVVCAARPLVELACPRAGAADDALRRLLQPRRLLGTAVAVAACATALLALTTVPATPTPFEVFGVARASAVGDDTAVVVPDVELDPGSREVAADFDQATAQRILRDVVVDLVVERRAFLRLDEELARTAASDDRLQVVVTSITDARRDGQTIFTSYELIHARAVVTPPTGQSAPEISFVASARIVALRHEGAPPSVDGAAVDVRIVVTPGSTGYLVQSITQ